MGYVFRSGNCFAGCIHVFGKFREKHELDVLIELDVFLK